MALKTKTIAEAPMENATVTISGNVLTLTIDLGRPTRLSKSGANALIATSAGNKIVGQLADGRDIIVGLNAYTTK